MSWRGSLPAACWQPEAVSAVIPVEAEGRSDPVFMATHSRLPLLMRSRVDSTEGDLVSELDLLRTVREQPEDYPVLPILGGAGAGKSHLVRWLRINLDPDLGTRKVFVPKHRTSLRGVVDRILEHGEGEVFDDLRDRIARAVDALGDDAEARLRLRNELATLVELYGVEAGSASDSEELELRRYLADKDSLPALLLDPWFRSSVLADDRPIARVVAEKLHGRGLEDKEDAIGFMPGDLRISMDDMARAGHAAREIAGALAADAQLPALAARMLNEQLETAVSAIFGLGGDDLKNLLVELRTELARRGEQLLVLIEDFSIFQGIQGGLLDAMTLIPSPETPICAMRVVLAVTTGYWTREIKDTVKSRTYRVFDLDVPAALRAGFEPEHFVAPYLNAARFGALRVENISHDGGTRIPSACNECPVVAECHDAFGDVDGVGLFPFNRPALRKAIASQTGSEGAFIARDVLTRVVRPVLHRDHQAINEERFPTEPFAKGFASGAQGVLDIEDEARLERPEDDSETNERRKRLVRFWSSGTGARNLSEVIHVAFAVPRIDTLPTPIESPAPGPEPPPPPPPPPPPAMVPALVQAVDRWVETGEFRQADRRELRKLVHVHLVARLGFDDGHWNASWWTDPSRAVPAFPEDAVLLGDERLPSTKGLALLRIERSGKDARALRALAWVSSVGSWREVRGGVPLQRLAIERLDTWAADVDRALFGENGDLLDEQLVAVVGALALGAKVLGVRVSFDDTLRNGLASLVALPEPSGEVPPPIRDIQEDVVSGRTRASITRSALRDWFLRLASFSQAGAPLALDVPRIAAAFRQVTYPLVVGERQPEELQRYIAVLEARIAGIDALFAALTAGLPDPGGIGGESIEAAVTRVNALLDHAAAVGKLPAGVDRAAIRQAGRELRPGDIDHITAVLEVMPRWENLDLADKLKLLTGDWYASAARLRTWVELTDEALEGLQKLLAAPGGESSGLEEVRQRLDAAIAQVAAAMEHLMSKPGGGVVA